MPIVEKRKKARPIIIAMSTHHIYRSIHAKIQLISFIQFFCCTVKRYITGQKRQHGLITGKQKLQDEFF